MSYVIPSNSADFRLSGAPYTVPSIADFKMDGRPLLFFAPTPELIRHYGSQWLTGTIRHRSNTAAYGSSRLVSTSRRQSSQQAKPVEALSYGLLWGGVTKKMEVMVSISHGESRRKETSTGDQWQQPERKDIRKLGVGWDKSIQEHDQRQASTWNHPLDRDSSISEGMQQVDLFSDRKRKSLAYLHPQQPLNFIFRELEYRPISNGSVFFQFGAFDKKDTAVTVDSIRRFTFRSNRAEDQPVILPWCFGQKAKDESVTGNYGGETNPVIVKPEPEKPEIRESYLLMNIITTVVLPDRTPLELPSMEISLDIDSFSWSFTGQLWGASNIALVEPDKDGLKQIEVNINGWKWIFIVERYSTDRRHGDERYTIYGSSRTQLLASPYAPQRSKSNGANLNAKQAITEELANTGFTATYPNLNDYSTPDWIMPGGSFSYQNQTAMQVVAKIATTAGSVIIPSRENDQVSIQPRYPASPWHWNTSTMDKIVPASMVISLSANWRPEQAYNAVYVSGTNAGVAVNVKRTGSNGNNPAPDILEDWLTETQVNTERGRNELAKGGNQSITTIELPLTDTNTAPGLIGPGMLVEVQDITGDWQALCLATSISASGVRNVVQSVDLERHY